MTQTAFMALHWGAVKQVIEIGRKTGIITGTVAPMVTTATITPAATSAVATPAQGSGRTRPRTSSGKASSTSRGRGGNG